MTDELAQAQARIRKLEADLREARAQNERERRLNGELALELYAARKTQRGDARGKAGK